MLSYPSFQLIELNWSKLKNLNRDRSWEHLWTRKLEISIQETPLKTKCHFHILSGEQNIPLAIVLSIKVWLKCRREFILFLYH